MDRSYRRRDDGADIAVACAPAHEPDVRAAVFGDEIAIDFPAVTAAVERMRDAFEAAEGAAALRVELRLTRVEASRGTVFPVDVPVRSLCGACGGRGETWTEPCARCGGYGHSLRRHQVRVSVPAGVADGSRFRFSVAPRHEPPILVELHVTVG